MPDPETFTPVRRGQRRIVAYGIAFESLLAILAILVGGWLGSFGWPAHAMDVVPTAGILAAGLAGTLPLLGMLFVLERIHSGPLGRLNELVKNQIVPLFAEASLGELLVLSIAAGVGEELLFRGALQSWLAQTSLGTVAAVVIAAILFGLLHRLSWTYALVATFVGCYFGWLLVQTESVWVPIIAHGLYDFVALVYLRARAAS